VFLNAVVLEGNVRTAKFTWIVDAVELVAELVAKGGGVVYDVLVGAGEDVGGGVVAHFGCCAIVRGRVGL
jgi:hypothetical protein